MKFNPKSLFIAGILALGSTTLASQAMAQTTAPVDFNGIVPGACTFGPVTNGVINANLAGDRLVTATPGRVGITCSEPAQVALTAPIPQSPAAIALTPAGGVGSVTSDVVSTSGANVGETGTDTTAMALPVAGTDQLDVSMSFLNNAALPAGTYAFRVTLTATP